MNLLKKAINKAIIISIMSIFLSPVMLAEVPDIRMDKQEMKFRGARVQVEFFKNELMHDMWESYQVVIFVDEGEEVRISDNGLLSIWINNKFVSSSGVTRSNREKVSPIIRNRASGKDTKIFFFSMNPDYLPKSNFTFSILGKDNEVISLCVVHLHDVYVASLKRSENGMSPSSEGGAQSTPPSQPPHK